MKVQISICILKAKYSMGLDQCLIETKHQKIKKINEECVLEVGFDYIFKAHIHIFFYVIEGK